MLRRTRELPLEKNQCGSSFGRFGITPNSSRCAELYLSPRRVFILQLWLAGVLC